MCFSSCVSHDRVSSIHYFAYSCVVIEFGGLLLDHCKLWSCPICFKSWPPIQLCESMIPWCECSSIVGSSRCITAIILFTFLSLDMLLIVRYEIRYIYTTQRRQLSFISDCFLSVYLNNRNFYQWYSLCLIQTRLQLSEQFCLELYQCKDAGGHCY